MQSPALGDRAEAAIPQSLDDARRLPATVGDRAAARYLHVNADRARTKAREMTLRHHRHQHPARRRVGNGMSFGVAPS